MGFLEHLEAEGEDLLIMEMERHQQVVLAAVEMDQREIIQVDLDLQILPELIIWVEVEEQVLAEEESDQMVVLE
jgi:hypothetical protein